MELQELPVTLYTGTDTLIGTVRIPDELRLLDLLNNGFNGERQRINSFLELIGVTISGTSGPKERRPILHIAKPMIHIIETPDSNSARGIGAKGDPKHHPYVQKSPSRVRLQLSNYTLIGDMHCASGETVLDVINAESMFLPLTNVKINAHGSDRWQPAAFLAVNRNEVYSLEIQ